MREAPSQLLSLRRTKEGNIQRTVRERYLRNDISCGSPACKSCLPSHPARLEKLPNVAFCDLYPQAHYVIPTSDVVVNQVQYVMTLRVVKNWYTLWSFLGQILLVDDCISNLRYVLPDGVVGTPRN